ncbi:type II secretion system F family protein [Streptomyces sp. Rer75]|uniref:type II secretion system F family protein n=1 Tax=Streptomyces sp. Rer75 TaxID=2750011 RepID=UPI00211E33F3|nr:type II secretion system F family protein [Streptomyces sp. Rer75]
MALTGLLLPAVVELLLTLGGRPLPWTMPLAGALAFAVGGFLLPDAMVRSEAAKRRAAFRHALSAFLNLVHLLLAGGAGVDGALADAARVGHGWAFQHLGRALDLARLTRTSPWATLGQLGDELDINELSELAAALSLAGTEGAKVRTSLAAKAAALRHQGGSEAEAEANAATERMTLPAALMAVGFIVFVFYPALTHVTTSL